MDLPRSPLNHEDPRLWIPLLAPYMSPTVHRSIDLIFQTTHKIYVMFTIPDYHRFRYLKISEDQIDLNDGDNNDDGGVDDHDGGCDDDGGDDDGGVDAGVVHDDPGHRLDDSAVGVGRDKDEIVGSRESAADGNQENKDDSKEEVREVVVEEIQAIEETELESPNQNIFKRYSMNHTLNFPSETSLNHPALPGPDRSFSLDSGHDGSPKKVSFLLNQPNVEFDSEVKSKPPIPIRGASKRVPIDELRAVLQAPPTDPQQNKAKGKRKTFFWMEII